MSDRQSFGIASFFGVADEGFEVGDGDGKRERERDKENESERARLNDASATECYFLRRRRRIFNFHDFSNEITPRL